MHPSFWHERWSEGQIGFHRSDVHPDLLSYHDTWLQGGQGILVPLCGKSVDVNWLAERRPTVGVELSALAVRALHDEAGRDADVVDQGAFRAWRSPGLTVLEGDVFALTPDHVQGVDRVWDRACLVALDPARRRQYVALLRALLPAGTRVLANVLSYDPDRMTPPPHAVPEAEVRALYDGCTVQVLDIDDTLPPRWAERGHTWFRRTLYGITL